jgi:hypothetical protein
MSEVNKAVMRRLIEEGFNKRNFSIINEMYLDCVYHSPEPEKSEVRQSSSFSSQCLARFPTLDIPWRTN